MNTVTKKVVATIEARMTSSRLPGKVLLPALGEPMLAHLIRRLRMVPSIDAIVIATTTNGADDPIAGFAKSESVLCYRGSENNVLSRVIGAAESAEADVVVEITGDCPIIDPDLIEQTIRMFFNHQLDYMSNSLIRSYPDGMDAQVFFLRALKRSAELTSDPLDLEHVSRYMCQHPEQFSLGHLIAPPSLHWPELGLTLDEDDDYRLLKKIIEALGPENLIFGCQDVIRFLKQNPELLEINCAVVRKGDS